QSVAEKFAAIQVVCDQICADTVASANAKFGSRFHYVPAPFGVTNAYGAGNSSLWELDVPFLALWTAATDNDELFGYRQSADLAQQGVDGGALPYSGTWFQHTLDE